MTHDELRERLQRIIHDLDSGRRSVPWPGLLGRRIGGSVIVAALGMGAAACAEPKPACHPDAEPTAAPTVDTGPVADDPAAEPEPPVDPGPVSEYAVVEPEPPLPEPEPVDDGPITEYMAVD